MHYTSRTIYCVQCTLYNVLCTMYCVLCTYYCLVATSLTLLMALCMALTTNTSDMARAMCCASTTLPCQLCVVWCGVVWCGVVWCGVVWCGVVWCGVVWCGVWCVVCSR
ncbi:hypothetical protein B484DRAFT_96665 [Ochromonadaceae sp. CCMP2298]|nr:hypothetical protein B484DRAFT_96665 [Ochromonadaceae sp. CCMP2298]